MTMRLHRAASDKAHYTITPPPPVGTAVQASFDNGKTWVNATPTTADGGTDVDVCGWELPPEQRTANMYVLPMKGHHSTILRYTDTPYRLIRPAHPGYIEVY